jgi:hypothetical protein
VVLARFFPQRADWLRAQAEEAAESRLLGGIHFRSDNESGLALGREVGRRVLEHVFREKVSEAVTPVMPFRAKALPPVE